MYETNGLDGNPLEPDDWIAAFNDLDGDGVGDICVGARRWDTATCNNGICDVAAMGEAYIGQDTLGVTTDYLRQGDIPGFRIYDASEAKYFDAYPSSILNIPLNTKPSFSKTKFDEG
jgi:hypothetical protein